MVLQVLTANVIDGRTKRVKYFTLMTDPTIDVQSGRLIASLNMSVIMRTMATLPFFKIRTNQDQMPLDKDGELL